MLRIGFSNKYFTLWNVDTRTEYQNAGGVFLPYEKTSFQYIKNLAMDEKEAKTKAIFEGVECFDVDPDLRGRTASFVTERTMFSKMPTDKSPFFEFGKYGGQKITDVHDQSYLFWYYQETKNIHCKDRLISEFGFVEWNEQLLSEDHFRTVRDREDVEKNVFESGEAIGKLTSNLSSEGIGRIEIDGMIFHCRFEEFTDQKYNGRKFYVPALNGKAKRMKGKLAIFKIVEDEVLSRAFVVKSFEFIKNQIIF